MKKILTAAIFSLAALAGMPAQAAPTVCTVSVNPGIAFTYNPVLGSGTARTGTLGLNCTTNQGSAQPYSIAVSSGSGSYANRKMKNALGVAILYNLYIDAGHSIVWGDGSGVTARLSGTYTKFQPNPSNNFYALISPASQNIPAGSYSDTLTLTVNF